MKFIIRLAGFELIERVKVRDVKTGKEFKKEFGEDAQLEEGEEFVTVFNNCSLIIGVENGTLTEKFIGGSPYKVDMTLAVYEGGADDEV